MSKRLSAAVLALLALLTLSLGACAAVGQAPLEKATLEKELVKQLGEAGYDVDAVKCPGDLDAEKGAKTTCELTAAGQPLDVGVTVTSVKDGTVYFDAVPEGEEEPAPAPESSAPPESTESTDPTGSASPSE